MFRKKWKVIRGQTTLSEDLVAITEMLELSGFNSFTMKLTIEVRIYKHDNTGSAGNKARR